MTTAGQYIGEKDIKPRAVNLEHILLTRDPVEDYDAVRKAYVDKIPAGPAGPQGATGPQGPPGSSYWDGWWPSLETWSFNQSFAPVYQIIAGGDVTARYSPGMRIKLTHAGATKYFIVTSRDYSSGLNLTNLYVYGGTDYTLAAGTITDMQYSTDKCPVGFPASPLKWSTGNTLNVNRMKSAPAANTWYNAADAGSFGNITIPHGIWRVRYEVSLYVQTASAQTNWSVGATLSTTTNSETNALMTSCIGGAGASSLNQSIGTVSRSQIITGSLTPTVYYLNLRTTHTGMDWIGQLNEFHGNRVIAAESAYL